MVVEASKPFSIYLRPFYITGEMQVAGGYGTPRRDPSGQIDLEEIAASAISEYFPLVAMGPEPAFPGAYRLPSDDENWKTKVASLISEAELIFLIPATTVGTMWEIEFIQQNNYLSKTVWIMPTAEDFHFTETLGISAHPFAQNSEPDSTFKAFWQQTRTEVKSRFGINLPWFDGLGAIFQITKDGDVSNYVSLNLFGRGELESDARQSGSHVEGKIFSPWAYSKKIDVFRDKLNYVLGYRLFLLNFKDAEVNINRISTFLSLYTIALVAFFIFFGANLELLYFTYLLGAGYMYDEFEDTFGISPSQYLRTNAQRVRDCEISEFTYKSRRISICIKRNSAFVLNYNHIIRKQKRAIIWLIPSSIFILLSISSVILVMLYQLISVFLSPGGFIFWVVIFPLILTIVYVCILVIRIMIEDLTIRIKRPSLIEKIHITSQDVIFWRHPIYDAEPITMNISNLIAIEIVDRRDCSDMDDANCGLVAFRFRGKTVFVLRNAAFDEIMEVMEKLSRIDYLNEKVRY